MAVTAAMEDLAAWLTAVWDEEERLARLAGGDRWILDGSIVHESHPSREVVDWVYDEADEHIVAHDPASVLARIAADRAILELHGVAWNAEVCTVCHHPHEDGETLDNDAWPCLTVRLLASPYADREGFRSEWLVERQGVEQ